MILVYATISRIMKVEMLNQASNSFSFFFFFFTFSMPTLGLGEHIT